MPSPVTGSKGTREWLLHARRSDDGDQTDSARTPAG
jgi:hypothetical protein